MYTNTGATKMDNSLFSMSYLTMNGNNIAQVRRQVFVQILTKWLSGKKEKKRVFALLLN